MRVAPTLVCLASATLAACIGPIQEYSEEASDETSEQGDGDGDGDPGDESGTDGGDGDGDPGTGDGDGDPSTGDGDGDGDPSTGDGDGDCKLGAPECACAEGKCEAGYECVDDTCMLSDYPWGKCGWDGENEWYGCGFQGESPDPNFPIDCGDLPLVSGAPCPDGLTVEGCCAYGGDSWWCKDGLVQRDPCGA